MSVSFETLKQLAREPSPQRRHELMRAISTAFFAAPRRTPIELSLFDDIMDTVLAEVEPLARRALAERIADLDAVPYRTLRRLARDAIEVAEPVLMRSPVLNDEDLAPIAREHSQEHLLAIARRLTVSEVVTDILVERGNDEVAGTVTGNEGARFSDAGFEWLAWGAHATPTGGPPRGGARAGPRSSTSRSRGAICRRASPWPRSPTPTSRSRSRS